MKQPYQKHILSGMGHDEWAHVKRSVKAGFQISAVLIVLLLVLGWMGERDAHASTQETQRVAFQVLEQCLGERPGVVKIGDEHFMCTANSMGVFK
jgi:hypothetical protein